MMQAVVTDHRLDTARGVYRLVFAFPVTEAVQVVDPDWTPPEPLEDGDQDAQEHVPAEQPPLIDQTVTIYTFPEEILWDASDPRWHDDAGDRRPAEDVAAEQQQIIKDLLDQRAVAAEHAANEPDPEAMPGIGQTL